MIDPLAIIASLCAHAGQASTATGFFGMAALGLAGSAAHCAPMCGPLVLGQGLHRLSCLSCARMNERQRLRAALLGRYHAGRLVTYALLGAVAGAAGFGLEHRLAPLRGGLLLAAALAMAVAAWRARLAGAQGPPGIGRDVAARGIGRDVAARGIGRDVAARGIGRDVAARGISRDAHTQHGAGASRGTARAGQPGWVAWTPRAGLTPGSFSFGMAMGLLPCGLIYTALVAACATASPWLGAAAMTCFGLATVPALVLVGIAGQAAPVQRGVQRLAPVLLAVNAGVLVMAALTRIFV